MSIVHLCDLLCCEQTRKFSAFPCHQGSGSSGAGGGVDDDDSYDNDDGCPFAEWRKPARAAWLRRGVGGNRSRILKKSVSFVNVGGKVWQESVCQRRRKGVARISLKLEERWSLVSLGKVCL